MFDETAASGRPFVTTLDDPEDVDWALRYLEEGLSIEVWAGRDLRENAVGDRSMPRLDLFALFLDRIDRSQFEIADLRPRRNWGAMRHARAPEVCTVRPIKRLDEKADFGSQDS